MQHAQRTPWVVGAPSLFRTTSRARVRLAAAELATTLRLSRIYALRHSANVGAKFRTLEDGVVTFTRHPVLPRGHHRASGEVPKLLEYGY